MLLNQRQADAIVQVLARGVELAANAMVELVRDDITVSLPSITVLPLHEVNASKFLPSVLLRFHGPIHGDLVLQFPVQSATKLAAALGIEPTSSGIKEVVEETGNILLNAVAGSVANCLGYDLVFDPPRFSDGPEAVLQGIGGRNQNPADPILVARACFELAESTIEGQILLHLDGASTEALTAALSSTVA
jgi:chemotaxis protein CheC